MAYMNQERKAKLAPGIKAVLKKYGMKGSISVRNHLSLVVTVTSGKIDMMASLKDRRAGVASTQVNTYHITSHWTGDAMRFLVELKNAMNVGNHDNSDPQIDYFDVGWYLDINVGKWNKPYVCEADSAILADPRADATATDMATGV